MIPALPAALLPFAEPRSCRCSARVSSGTGRFSLRPSLCCRLPSLKAAAFRPGFLCNGTAALASIPYYYNIAKFLYGRESLQKNSIAIFLPCNAGVSLFLLFSAPHFKSVTPDSSEIAAVEKHLARSGLVRFRPADPPADAVRAETFRRSAVCTVEQLSEEKRRRFTPCRHFGAGSLTDRHVSSAPSILYAPICSLARQFVALFIPQQQLFCPMPHCFRKQTNSYCSTRFIRPPHLFAPGNFADPAPFKIPETGSLL